MKFWKEASPLIKALIVIIPAAIAYGALTATVNATSVRIDKLENKQDALTSAIAVQNATAARIEQKVDYIREDLNRRDR